MNYEGGSESKARSRHQWLSSVSLGDAETVCDRYHHCRRPEESADSWVRRLPSSTTSTRRRGRAPRIPVSTRSHRAHEHSSSDPRVADGVCATRYHRLRKEHIIPI